VTVSGTYGPTPTPTVLPSTTQPSFTPTAVPSYTPSISPSVFSTTGPPSCIPTITPTVAPTTQPTELIITTIAGSSTSGSFSGDNSQASSAGLNLPFGVSLDASGNHISLIRDIRPQRNYFHCYSLLGNVYIADYSNHRIRKVTVSTGIIITIAGTGTSSYSGDNGQATSAALYDPRGVTVDTSG